MFKLFLCNLKTKLFVSSGSWLRYLTQHQHLPCVSLQQEESRPTQCWLGSYLQISSHLHKKKMCECVFLWVFKEVNVRVFTSSQFYRIIWSCLKMQAKVFKSKENNLWRGIQCPAKNVTCLVWEYIHSKEAINECLSTLSAVMTFTWSWDMLHGIL